MIYNMAIKDVTNRSKMIRNTLIFFLTLFKIEFWPSKKFVGIGRRKETVLLRVGGMVNEDKYCRR